MAHDNKKDRCPGCSKHCSCANPRCKFGRAYFAKKAQQPEKKTEQKKQEQKKKPAEPKWASYVEKNGLAWQILSAGRSIKKALKSKKATEAQIMNALTDAEKAALGALLSKLCSEKEI